MRCEKTEVPVFAGIMFCPYKNRDSLYTGSVGSVPARSVLAKTETPVDNNTDRIVIAGQDISMFQHANVSTFQRTNAIVR